jgi:hypothetical protein
MIMPTKYQTENETILGVSAVILQKISKRVALSSLWDKVKDNKYVGTFERFVLGLVLLKILGLIDIKDNEIIRTVI